MRLNKNKKRVYIYIQVNSASYYILTAAIAVGGDISPQWERHLS